MKALYLKLFLPLLILAGCSGVSIIKPGDFSHLYRKSFLDRIKVIKAEYSKGQAREALQKLERFDESKLLPAEKAYQRNLIGVIYFALDNYEEAIINFDLASSTSSLDQSLMAQINLNLASAHYKMGSFVKAEYFINTIQHQALNEKELKKYWHLSYILANQKEDSSRVLRSLTNYLSFKKDLNALRQSPLLGKLVSHFSKLSWSEKIRYLEDFSEKQYLTAAYLGYIESEKLYFSGKKSEAKDLIAWVTDNFQSRREVIKLMDDFAFRIDNFSKIDATKIGIVLPFSDKKRGDFAKRVMRGIDSAYQEIFRKQGNDMNAPTLMLKDSLGSGVVGAHSVKELVEKHYVSIIIGGLFSEEAEREYIEAKKFGVFFISLSPIYLPREKKDHLLLEIPGSVESQLAMIFSKSMLDKFGRRAVILYPNSSRGKSYVNEFWRLSELNQVSVEGVQSYEEEATDFRDPVKNLLGLKYPRERVEELELLASIHSLEEKRGARRIQTLPPQIDFDWVFVPSFPYETIQLIPSFAYFDAYNLNFIGGPSWRSKTLVKQSRSLGKLFFVGDDVESRLQTFKEEFYKEYKTAPRLIEIMAHDAMKVAGEILAEANFTSRDELEMHIRSKAALRGLVGEWEFKDNLWNKKMVPLELHKGNITRLIFEGDLNGDANLMIDQPKSETPPKTEVQAKN